MNFKYSYSLDEEHFDGDFDSYAVAAEAAFYDNPDVDSVSVGINTPFTAHDFVNGRDLLEVIGENAFEECGEPAFNWLKQIQDNTLKLAEFEKLISDWLDLNAPVAFLTVDEIQKITRP